MRCRGSFHAASGLTPDTLPSLSWNFIIARFTPTMFEQVSRTRRLARTVVPDWQRLTHLLPVQMGWGVYIFFATMMVLSVPYIVFLLPETKNVSPLRPP